jgi:hypothetical protein
LAGDQGPVQAARGCRVLQDPPFLAAALSLKKPERLMAVFMVMSVGWLVYAAVEDRIRHARTDHEATCPDQPGQPSHKPTARWVLQDLVGMHGRCQAGQWPIVLQGTEAPQPWRDRLGQPDMRLYDVSYASKSRGRCGMSGK